MFKLVLGFCYLLNVGYFGRLYTSGFLQLDDQPFGSLKDLNTLKFSVCPVEKALGLISWSGKPACVS